MSLNLVLGLRLANDNLSCRVWMKCAKGHKVKVSESTQDWFAQDNKGMYGTSEILLRTLPTRKTHMKVLGKRAPQRGQARYNYGSAATSRGYL